jgi:hypothetical protein
MNSKQSAAKAGFRDVRALVWLSLALSMSILCAWVNWHLFSPLDFMAPKLWRGLLRSIIFMDIFQVVSFVAAVMAVRLTLGRLSGRTILRVVIATALVVLGISIVTLPTRSQDFYHDALLIQQYVSNGANPYIVTPTEVGGPWLAYLLNWLDVGYIYGPLFALCMAAIFATHQSLFMAAITVKILSVLAVGLTAWFMWRIMQDRPMGQKAMVLTLFCLNPLTVQAGVVDMHNDVFIGLGLTAGYYFFANKRHVMSLWMLTIAGLGKFVSVVLVPLPILGIIYGRSLSRAQKLRQLLLAGAGSLFASTLVFAPFGLKEALSGISIMTSFRLPSYESVGSLLLMDGLGVSVLAVRILGAGLAVGAGAYLFRQKQSPRQFIIPIAVFLFMGFAVFQPWYLLWILPLICISERYWVVLALSIPFSLLSPNINYSVLKATSICILLIVGGILCKNISNSRQKYSTSKAHEPRTV